MATLVISHIYKDRLQTYVPARWPIAAVLRGSDSIFSDLKIVEIPQESFLIVCMLLESRKTECTGPSFVGHMYAFVNS